MGLNKTSLLPREKAIKFGINSLSDAELLAIILRTGNKNEDVIQLSSRIIHQFNGLCFLKNCSYADLCSIKGLKEAKALNLMAIFEISKRIINKNEDIILDEFDAYQYIYPHFETFDQECCYAMYLNSRNKVIAIRLISKGSINSSIFDVNDIIREGLKVNSRRFILFHNHPSGNKQPSEQDISTTRNIVSKCKTLNLILLDHLIIVFNDFCSMKRENLI